MDQIRARILLRNQGLAFIFQSLWDPGTFTHNSTLFTGLRERERERERERASNSFFAGTLKTSANDAAYTQNVSKRHLQEMHNSFMELGEAVHSMMNSRQDDDDQTERKIQTLRSDLTRYRAEFRSQLAANALTNGGGESSERSHQLSELMSKVKDLESGWAEDREQLFNRTSTLDAVFRETSGSLSQEIENRGSYEEESRTVLRNRLDSANERQIQVQEEIENVQGDVADNNLKIRTLETALNDSLQIMDILKNNHSKLVDQSISLIRRHLDLFGPEDPKKGS